MTTSLDPIHPTPSPNPKSISTPNILEPQIIGHESTFSNHPPATQITNEESLNDPESDASPCFFDTSLFEEKIDEALLKQRQPEKYHYVPIPCENLHEVLARRVECVDHEEWVREWRREQERRTRDETHESSHVDAESTNQHLIFHVLSAQEHSLWAHCIWNSGKALAKAILNGVIDMRGKRVLELGSAVGLPGMAAALMGARMVVATDYPEEPVLKPLRQNYETNVGLLKGLQERNWKVLGYRWGAPVDALLEANDNLPFDMVFQTDLIFNHSEHRPLMESVRMVARGRTTPIETYVYFSHHRTWLIKEDLNLFKIAKEKGFVREDLYEDKYPVMFEEDAKNDRSEEDYELRRTVHAIRLDYTPPSVEQ